MKVQKKSFIKGALILAVANLIVKLIGAFFKVPLYELLDKEGSGLFNVAYQIYTFMFIIATAGFPIAVSKMVAEAIAKGNTCEANKIFRAARLLLGVIGIIGSLILFFFAEPLTKFLNNPDAALVIKVISPSVFLVALVSAYRGYFQGKQNMYPTAASEVIEATAKLLVGIAFAIYFLRMDIDPSLAPQLIDIKAGKIVSESMRTVFAAAGAIFGVTTGTLCSLVLMFTVNLFTKKEVYSLGNTRTTSSILKELVMISIPITIGASVSSLTSLVDLGTIMNRLVINPQVFDHYNFLFEEGTDFFRRAAIEGWTEFHTLQQKANTLYGMYTGQAQTMFNLPLTIVVALGMSVVPAISSAVAGGNPLDAKKITESSLRITMLFAFPCAVGLSVLAKPILELLYSDSDAYLLLQKLSLAVVFVSVVSVTNSILQAYGKVYYPVVNMLIGGVVKVFMNYNLIPVLGIDGAPIATNVCYGVIAVLNLICVIRFVKIRFSLLDFILRPLAASLVMGAASVSVLSLISSVLGSGRLTTLFAVFCGGVIYVIMIFIVGAIKKDDLSNIPGGTKILPALERFRLIK